MPQLDYEAAHPRARLIQAGVSLLLVATIGATFAGLAWVARSNWVEETLLNWEARRFQRGEELAMQRGAFLDFEDRVVLRDIPEADYAKGGVYFFGSSPMKWAIESWKSGPTERRLIRNHSIGATNHGLQFQLIRYLTEQRGFLKAGERTQVVLGAYWAMGLSWKPAAFFGPLWQRYGLYTYSDDAGIGVAAGSDVERTLRQEKARCSSLVKGTANRLARVIAVAVGVPLDTTVSPRDPAGIRRVSGAEVEDFQADLRLQMELLDQQIAYLREHGVGVTVVLLPTREPIRECSLPKAYRDRVVEISESRGVPFVDLSGLLSEDEYWDTNHSNHAGIQKSHVALMQLAADHLLRVGLILGGSERSIPEE